MIKKKFTSLLILGISLYAFSISTYAQSDAVKISTAKYAIEKEKDYKFALETLYGVSQSGKNQQLCVYYFAKAFDNLNNYDSAIIFYNKYLEFMPDNAEIVKRVSELTYKEIKNKKIRDKYQSIFNEWLSKSKKIGWKKKGATVENNNQYRIDANLKIWFGNNLVFEPNNSKINFEEDGTLAIEGAIHNLSDFTYENWELNNEQIKSLDDARGNMDEYILYIVTRIKDGNISYEDEISINRNKHSLGDKVIYNWKLYLEKANN